MFVITIETGFTAGHQLTFASGEREPLHSHDWLVRTAVSADKLDDSGLAIDFIELKGTIETVTAGFGGIRLEDLDCFGDAGASAEQVAQYIYDKVEPLLPSHVKLEYIEVMESPGCWAKYIK